MTTDEAVKIFALMSTFALMMTPPLPAAVQAEEADERAFSQLCQEWGQNGRIRPGVSGGLVGLLGRLQQFVNTYPASRFSDAAAYLHIRYEVGLHESEKERVRNLAAWVNQYHSVHIEDPAT